MAQMIEVAETDVRRAELLVNAAGPAGLTATQLADKMRVSRKYAGALLVELAMRTLAGEYETDG